MPAARIDVVTARQAPHGPDETPNYTILELLGYEDRVIALVLDEHPAGSSGARLSWRPGHSQVVAEDIETPTKAVGPIVDRPITVSGIELFLNGPLTVTDAIDYYASLVVERDRKTLEDIRKRAHDPEEQRRQREVFGRSLTPEEFVDPETVTEEASRASAAEEIIRISVEALVRLGTRGLGRLHRELEDAAADHPAVVLELFHQSEQERQSRSDTSWES